MGKKSRLKRERRTDPSNVLARMMDERSGGARDHDVDFQHRETQLCELFSQYNAEDVALALGVSDLWLPNISAQVKHHFALGVFVSMNADRFTPSNGLNTYAAFCEFIGSVHALLPSFPSLEDFIPEPDWGEVRVSSKRAFFKIFYGGSVERIPDFIEAFKWLHEAQPAALNDMNLAIALQDRLISSVRKEVIGSAEEIDSGHVETPSEAFWWECRQALLSACDVLPTGADDICPALVLELGKFRRLATWSSFGDAVMNGTSLPAVVVDVNGKRLPLSPRNATSVVIDLWAGKAGVQSSILEAALCRCVANFLSLRLASGTVVGGPLKLVSRKTRLSYRFAAVVRTKKTFYFIAIIDEKTLPMLGRMEQEVHELLVGGEGWGLLPEGHRNAIGFRRSDGTQPGATDVAILAVLARVATSWIHLAMPDTSARVIPLSDFVTVFDSLEDADELDRFWAYVDSSKPLLGFMSRGPADLFGSFRDSNAVLVDGANLPTMISLDPHWGSNWRYKELTQFWAAAPPQFPDDTLAWNVDAGNDGLQRLVAKGSPTLAWCATVGGCAVHIVFRVLEQDLDLLNGRMLELFVHCFADAVSQRRPLLEQHPLFCRSRIVVACRASSTTLATEMENESTEKNVNKPLLSGWRLNSDADAPSLAIKVEVNLARVQSRLNSPADASFEVECISDGIAGISSLVGLTLSADLTSSLLATSSRRPRFTVKRVRRTVDVPDFSTVETPKPEQYKIARRELAIVLKNQGVKPGRYELAQAKGIIDPARDRLRAQIHMQIAALNRRALLLFCIEQHDALAAEYRREVFRVTQSLEHEVSFDRSEAIADAHDSFTRGARNYRYLLECAVTASASGLVPVSAPEVVQLIASIDWLFVLYGASDVLHNDIEAAGLELDHSFIPQVFYSENREAREKKFSLEMANAKLGVDLQQEDEVTSAQEDGKDWGGMDQAFVEDLGFSLTQLRQMLLVLARWQSMGGESDLRLSYQASAATIADKLKESIDGLADDAAKRLVDFATLDSAKVRRLLGKTTDESDVPVWEHTKRGNASIAHARLAFLVMPR